jgi:hypothetical protein
MRGYPAELVKLTETVAFMRHRGAPAGSGVPIEMFWFNPARAFPSSRYRLEIFSSHLVERRCWLASNATTRIN